MLSGWEGNRRSGVALVMRHRLSDTSSIRSMTRDEHPAHTSTERLLIIACVTGINGHLTSKTYFILSDSTMFVYRFSISVRADQFRHTVKVLSTKLVRTTGNEELRRRSSHPATENHFGESLTT